MRISSLAIHNFRPFYGRHEIDLSPAEGNPLVLFQGENQTGKTALFLALYWCLYGTAKDRHGVTLPVFQPGERENDYLFNQKAAEEGLTEMRVTLRFLHEAREWEMTRLATCDGDPLNGGQFKVEAILKIGDEPIVSAEVTRRLNDVLHHDAAQFYFFDGELLSEYEKWLADPLTAQQRVREAIERTVGISAFRLGPHVATVAEEFQKEVTQAQRKERRNKQLLDDRDALERRIAEIDEEISDHKGEIDRLEAEAERIQQIHGDLAAWREAITKIGDLERRVEEAREKRHLAFGSIRELVHEKYWMPLGSRAQQLTATVLGQIEDAFASPRHSAARSLEGQECLTCGRKLDDAARAHIASLLGDEADGGLSTVEQVRLAALRLEQANEFVDPSALDLLEKLEEDRTSAEIEAETSDEQAHKLRQQHIVRGDYETEMRRLDQIHEDLVTTRKAMEGAEEERVERIGALESLDTKIARSGTADPALSKRSRSASLAASAFKVALGLFAQRARDRVQEGATDAFKALVRNEGYDGIQITDDFVVLPVDAEGKVQTAPSSGGQQLLTLALIAGLNSAAVHDAPIVMDTPFGRLDVGNRERILRWAQKLVRERDQQIVLMVHSGELTLKDLGAWNVAPGRVYRIVPTAVHGHEIIPSD